MKIVLNKNHGSFGLSILAIKEYLELLGEESFFYRTDYIDNEEEYKEQFILVDFDKIKNDKYIDTFVVFTKNLGEIVESSEHYLSFNQFEIERTDSNLIKVVEKLGEKANSKSSTLKVIEIPDGISYYINNNCGLEYLHEEHRIW